MQLSTVKPTPRQILLLPSLRLFLLLMCFGQQAPCTGNASTNPRGREIMLVVCAAHLCPKWCGETFRIPSLHPEESLGHSCSVGLSSLPTKHLSSTLSASSQHDESLCCLDQEIWTNLSLITLLGAQDVKSIQSRGRN